MVSNLKSRLAGREKSDRGRRKQKQTNEQD
jgi:hypothetical protein